MKQSKYQHKTITISNTYSQSLIEDQQYKTGDIFFLSIPNQDINQASIIDSKRDTTLALL
ncbi:hypothetical protein [Vagococcus jeotgali]|uniref:hypothetical protein n=1 Tax=Vagococcus jeotgali TaxID=3109030 RepID=UPI002DDC6899|nr:hypothetical protein [Vagococcus sp. B2T-5]